MLYCPIISYQKEYRSKTECMGEECMFWDAEHNTCLMKSLMVTALTKASRTEKTIQRIDEELEARARYAQMDIGGIFS